MVGDLIDSQLLIGKREPEVRDLLGAPDHATPVSVRYRLDYGHKFGRDPWLYDLVIAFDGDGHVGSLQVLD